MSWPNGPKSINRDSGKITKLTKVLKLILIADLFWLRLQITARPVKRITGQYSLLRTCALTWVLDQSLSHSHFASNEHLFCTLYPCLSWSSNRSSAFDSILHTFLIPVHVTFPDHMSILFQYGSIEPLLIV